MPKVLCLNKTSSPKKGKLRCMISKFCSYFQTLFMLQSLEVRGSQEEVIISTGITIQMFVNYIFLALVRIKEWLKTETWSAWA